MLEDFRLKVFVTVARLGSFTRAARELGVTQPAVSQNIAELEKHLGVPLFVRTRGSVTLTAAGITFHEYATRILGSYSSIASVFGGQGSRGNRSPVRIAAGAAAASSVLPALCARFFSSMPGASVKVVAEDAEDRDLKVSLAQSSGSTLFSGESTAATLEATAVCSGLEYSRITDLEKLPSEASVAVWTPYAAMLPLNARAKVALDSEYADILLCAARRNPAMVAVVPSLTVGSDLHPLPVNLSRLGMDVIMEPSASFKTDPLCSLLIQMAGEC